MSQIRGRRGHAAAPPPGSLRRRLRNGRCNSCGQPFQSVQSYDAHVTRSCSRAQPWDAEAYPEECFALPDPHVLAQAIGEELLGQLWARLKRAGL